MHAAQVSVGMLGVMVGMELQVTKKYRLDNFQEFFANSYADEIKLLDESISFKRTYGDKGII